MTRHELYERVWQTPISKLASEFGVSGVSLASLCRKHDVPVPPRGYWAKIAAGKKPRRLKLPAPRVAADVVMPGGQATLRGQQANLRPRAIPQPIQPPKPVTVPETLAGCDPIVKRTAAFFASIQAQVEAQAKRDARHRRADREPELVFVPRGVNGRHQCAQEGCIDVTASLANIDWVGRFLQAFVIAVRACGADVVSRSENRVTGSAKRVTGSTITVAGHGVEFVLSEGFDKVLAKHQQYPSFAQYDYHPLNVYKFRLRRNTRLDKTIEWSRTNLEEDVAGFAAKVVAAVREDQAFQADRDREEAEKRERAAARAIESDAWFAEQERLGARRKARKAQLERALEVGKAQMRHEATLRALETIESRIPGHAMSEGVRTWLALVRGLLKSPVDDLLAELLREVSAEGGAQWWPDELTPTGGRQ